MPSALFANQRETNLASTLVLVEEVLAELGHSAAATRVTDPTALHAWRIPKGSAVTHVALLDRSDFSHLRVRAVVMTLDPRVDRAVLFGHLLSLNAQLAGAAFALERERVLLVSERTTLDLDRSEVLDIIRRVVTLADEHDDLLVARFGGTLGER